MIDVTLISNIKLNPKFRPKLDRESPGEFLENGADRGKHSRSDCCGFHNYNSPEEAPHNYYHNGVVPIGKRYTTTNSGLKCIRTHCTNPFREDSARQTCYLHNFD